MIENQAGLKGQYYFPLFFLTFGFVLLCNVLGLTPYAFTPTSHIIVTFMIAFSFFIGLTVIGFMRQGLAFLQIFVPSGVPLAILPLMILIEIMSYCIRPISLSVRLFANMLAGHTLLHIVAGFGVNLLKINLIFGLLPIMLLLAITGLEFGIAFLQAYVFVILLSIYLNDSLNTAAH
jgi:F-type H+-transporting ATPase subunit a